MNKILEDLKKLKNAFNETVDISVGEIKLKLALLNAENEVDVHSIASEHEQGLAYLFTIKRETVCRAIISLNGQDLEDFLEEGEEKVQRHIWLRKNIISGWSQYIIDSIWMEYSKLVQKLEDDFVIKPEKLEEKEEEKEQTEVKNSEK